ncbi:unnamed protein product [Toxocara canis]|uniref:Uncharacterized protein n=1 Tax=Toxocara canis TaxID=6265 RepID=A0A183UKN4_TOXCA|nr:unnamed protein product [Toxocara canis]
MAENLRCDLCPLGPAQSGMTYWKDFTGLAEGAVAVRTPLKPNQCLRSVYFFHSLKLPPPKKTWRNDWKLENVQP